MKQFHLLETTNTVPAAADTDLAALGWAKWQDALAELDDETAAAGREFEAEPLGRSLLDCLFGNSPFLTQILVRDTASFLQLARNGADSVFDEIIATNIHAAGLSDNDLMADLRRRRNTVALAVGVADITATWALEKVTDALSEFAASAIHRATNQLIGWAIQNEHLEGDESSNPAETSGYTVIGMGKLGARELNYSSDVDLIVLYDQERIRYRGSDSSPQSLFVDLTRRLVRVLQDRTADGYVFRTDLRLRPDPGATPLALSMAAAERYYESVGQNWERAAFIKARAIAGDRGAGGEFLDRITPFIWRRHLDFAAFDKTTDNCPSGPRSDGDRWTQCKNRKRRYQRNRVLCSNTTAYCRRTRFFIKRKTNRTGSCCP